jgi:hypothetical protein
VGGIVLGFIIGIILGVLYYNLIISTGHPDIAYFNQVISDNTQCSKPGPTKFRCKKYVRGNRDSNGIYVPREVQFDTEISDDEEEEDEEKNKKKGEKKKNKKKNEEEEDEEEEDEEEGLEAVTAKEALAKRREATEAREAAKKAAA